MIPVSRTDELLMMRRGNADRYPGWKLVWIVEIPEPLDYTVILQTRFNRHVTIDWGDGSGPAEYSGAERRTHSYGAAGTYVVRSTWDWLDYLQLGMNGCGQYVTSIDKAWLPECNSIQNFVRNCVNLRRCAEVWYTGSTGPLAAFYDVPALESLKVHLKIGSSDMCRNCGSLRYLEEHVEGAQNQSHAPSVMPNLEELVYDAPNATSLYAFVANLPKLRSFVLSPGTGEKATSINSAFYTLLALDGPSRTFDHDFPAATSSVSVFMRSVLETIATDLRSTLNMNQLCQECLHLRSFRLKAGAPLCTTMDTSFQDCVKLETVVLGDLSSVTSARTAFSNCVNLRTVSISSLASLVEGRSMFKLTALDSFPVSALPKVEQAGEMFADVRNMRTVSLPGGLPKAQVVQSMFARCYELETFEIGDIPLATNFQTMLNDCKALVSFTMGNAPAATNMTSLLANDRSLVTCRIGTLSSLTDISTMLTGCESLRVADIGFGLPVVKAQGAFSTCFALVEPPAALRLSPECTNFYQLFYSCYALRHLPARLWPENGFTAATVDARYALAGCRSLVDRLPAEILWEDTSRSWYASQFVDSNCTNVANYQNIPVTWGGPADLMVLMKDQDGNPLRNATYTLSRNGEQIASGCAYGTYPGSLSNGTYTVSFDPLPGYAAPAAQSASVTTNTLRTVNATYTRSA